jgi:hypothetical protein
MYAADRALATGSSFFWTRGPRTFLVTNWHNVSGYNHLSGELLSKTGAVPDRLGFRVFQRVSEPDPEGFFELQSVERRIDLFDSSGSVWLEHPCLGHRVDVVAVDVSAAIAGCQVAGANDVESDAVLDNVVSQDAFILGFPFGLIANAPVPIWKRGTIALDPSFDADGLPKTLIDTATREGMSGSVVVARHITVGRPFKKKDGTQVSPVLYAKHDLVVGIYSGRQYPDLERAQLGIVWKRRVIDEILSQVDGEPRIAV